PPSLTLLPYTTLFRSLDVGGVHARRVVDCVRIAAAAVAVEFDAGELGHAEVRPLADNLRPNLVRRHADGVVAAVTHALVGFGGRSEEHTSELQSRENL